MTTLQSDHPAGPRRGPARDGDDASVARDYFAGLAADYQAAFGGHARNPLDRVINRLFRRRTFALRSALVLETLAARPLAGKTVLDVGCGSGDLTVRVAQLGVAHVHGVDIAAPMLDLARRQAQAAGVSEKVTLTLGDALRDALPQADITMAVGVIEYYGDLARLLSRMAEATRETLVIVDTRGPLWRRALRHLLAWWRGFRIYYRPPQAVADLLAPLGFAETTRHRGHSFTLFVFDRR
jgi:2-polyprenyl-3-methyl-5-hydroxy-6-metoxy-1,4-benzoquinol methylase